MYEYQLWNITLTLQTCKHVHVAVCQIIGYANWTATRHGVVIPAKWNWGMTSGMTTLGSPQNSTLRPNIVYIIVYIYIYTCLYIYICIERERDTTIYIYIYVLSIYLSIHPSIHLSMYRFIYQSRWAGSQLPEDPPLAKGGGRRQPTFTVPQKGYAKRGSNRQIAKRSP